MRLWRRFGQRPRAAGILGLALVIVLAVVIGPFFYGRDSDLINATALYQAPSGAHPFGTDQLGRDLLLRCLYGGRLSLTIASGATAIAIVLGSTWGLSAGFWRGWVDQLLMRSADAMMTIPEIMLAMVFIAVLGASVGSLTLIIGLALVPVTARIMRSAILTELTSDYYLAAVASGASPIRIILSELLPNTAPTLLARASLCFAAAILLEAGLSFIGLGVQPPQASWGTLVQSGYGVLFESPTYFVFPGALILLSIFAFNGLADEVQVILDARS